MRDADDARRVRAAALRVGMWVGIASALIIAGGSGVLVAIILLRARPEYESGGHESPERVGDADGAVGPLGLDHIVIDVDRIVVWVLVLGVIGVALLALVAWFAARRAVAPLAEALRTQRTFVSDASHELRTPLTALTSRIQILQRRAERGEPVDQAIRDLRRNAATMDDVLTDLLLSAESDAAGDGATADAGECARSAADSLAPVASERSVAIVVDAPGDIVAAIPAVTLTRLLVALVDNAAQHSPEGASIRVAVEPAGRRVRVRVADSGGGIAAEDRERIFERFARSGETGRRRGFGLGLALVREVAQRHGGSVHVEQSSPAGSTFLLELPAAGPGAMQRGRGGRVRH